MAHKVENEKEFLILKTSRSEIVSLHPMNLGICDRCCSSKETEGFYVAVLNYWMCSKCYEEWYNKAERYPEDISFETMKFNEISNAIRLIESNN